MAVDFLKENGFGRSDAAIARSVGLKPPVFCMDMNGDRAPTWETLLKLCDIYPINFWWLRSGEGEMVGGSIREHALLQKISKLEGRIKELEAQKLAQ